VVGGLLGDAIGLRPTLVVAAVGGTLAFAWLLRSPIASTRGMDDLDLPEPVTAPAAAG
jgi:predicted MFS family arabinose efflux permease